MKRIFLFSLILWAFISPWDARTDELRTDMLLGEIAQAVSGERARDHVARLWLHDRWSDFPAWHESAEEAVKIMKERGFDIAETVHIPADGITKFGDWTSPVGWDCRQATLEVIEPDRLPDEIKYLCDYLKNPTSLNIWSKPTPPEGIEAELCVLESRDPEELKKAAGKIILTNERAGGEGLNKLVHDHGIVGIVTDYIEEGSSKFVDANQWQNQMSDIPLGWGHTVKDSRQFIFSISPAKGGFLRELLRRGTRVTVRAKIDSRLYTDGTLPYVTGALLGSGPEGEEVFAGGHMFEHGANDNSTGVSSIIEAIGTLNDLIEQGALPKPKRTIRVWFGFEMYGSMPFIVHNLERMQRQTIAALAIDTGAPDYDLSTTAMHVMMNPNVCPSYTDAVLADIAGAYYSRYSRSKLWSTSGYSQGTDTHFCEPMIGVPTNALDMESGGVLHHNSMDTIDKVDPRSLRDLVTVCAVYLYYMANAGADEIPRIAELTFNHGAEVMLEKAKRTKERIMDANTGEDFTEALALGLKIAEFETGAQKEALRKIARVADAGDIQKTDLSIASYLDNFDALGKMCAEQIMKVAERRAVEEKFPKELTRNEDESWRREAASIIPQRKIIGTITLEGIPFSEWEEVSMSPRFWGRTNPASASYWWCDGKRNLLEIRDLVEIEAERRIENFDLVKYYEFLRRHSLIDYAGK